MNRTKCMKIDIPTFKVEVICGNQSSQDGLVNLDPKKKKKKLEEEQNFMSGSKIYKNGNCDMR